MTGRIDYGNQNGRASERRVIRWTTGAFHMSTETLCMRSHAIIGMAVLAFASCSLARAQDGNEKPPSDPRPSSAQDPGTTSVTMSTFMTWKAHQDSAESLLERLRKELQFLRANDVTEGQRVMRLKQASSILMESASLAKQASFQTHDLVAIQARIASAQKILADTEDAVAVLPNKWIQFHAGVAAAAHSIKKGSEPPLYRLTKGDSPHYYVEADFQNRLAWLNPENRLATSGTLLPKDYELRLGLASGDKNFSASTQAAASDWYSEISLGWPLSGANLCSSMDNTKPRWTLNAELNAGFATDRAGLAVRGYYQSGFAFAAGIPVNMSDGHYSLATVLTGLYYGIHEYPKTERDMGSYTTDEVPPFSRLGSLGVKIDIGVPVTTTTSIVIGGRLAVPVSRYDVPDDWSLFIGISLKSLKGLFGA